MGRGADMMDEVYINQEADPYVLEIDGILDLAGLNLQPASIVINRKRGLVDAQTSKTKRSFADIQQNVLHDFVAGSKAHPLQITGTPLAVRLEQHGQQQTFDADNTGHSAIHSVLRKQFPAGTEMMQAGQFDQLVCEIMELLDQYTGKLSLKRKRNAGEASLTLVAKRPNLCVLVEFLLCYAMAGGHVRDHLDQRQVHDLALVGQLLTEPGLPPLDELGSLFAEALMAKSLSLQGVLHHVWLQS
ncbi:hypothetical protein WJX82_002017 [Trebouxia sp. C0006]